MGVTKFEDSLGRNFFLFRQANRPTYIIYNNDLIGLLFSPDGALYTILESRFLCPFAPLLVSTGTISLFFE